MSVASPMLSWRALVLNTKIHRNAKFLALVLSTYMSCLGDSASMSVAELAGRSGMSPSTTSRALNALIESGWLIKQNKFKDGEGQTANSYTATYPRADETA